MSFSSKNLVPIMVAGGIGTVLGYGAAFLTKKQVAEKQSSGGSVSIPEKTKRSIKGSAVELSPDKVFHVPHLREIVGEKHNKHRPNIKFSKSQELNRNLPLRNYQSDDDIILYDIVQNVEQKKTSSSAEPETKVDSEGENPDDEEPEVAIKNIKGFVRAGPREECWFDAQDINVALCTTGGLCPGLNNIVRGITNALLYTYGVKHVYGVRNGFKGFSEDPFELTSRNVRYINEEGGSFIGSSRGSFDANVIIDWLQRYNVHAIFIIGGDGSHRAAYRLYEEISSRKLNISVAGVPKTIDNDIAFIDRSFGFDTAVEEAAKAVRSARTEAKSTKNGIGIVKLMGRTAGSIAAFTAMSTGMVDLCLIPEVPFHLDGNFGGLTWISEVLKRKGYAVIVIAEGIAESLVNTAEKEKLLPEEDLKKIRDDSKKLGTDEGGNKRFTDAGPIMVKITKNFLNSRLKESEQVTIKYIDPSYLIRSVPANSSDSVLCLILSQSAAHGVMAGYTGFSIGLVNNRTVYIPMKEITDNSPKLLRANGRTWERITIATGQPDYRDEELPPVTPRE